MCLNFKNWLVCTILGRWYWVWGRKKMYQVLDEYCYRVLNLHEVITM